MRYADDIIVGFETQRDAERYLNALPERLAKFHLRLAEEKSGLVKFNRWELKGGGFRKLGNTKSRLPLPATQARNRHA